MPKSDDDDRIDGEDDLDLDTSSGDDDDEALREIIRKAIGEDDDADDDIFAEFKEPEANKTVSMEEGLDLIDKASTKKRKADAADDPIADAEAADKADKQDDAADTTKDEAKTETEAPGIDALLEGLPDDRKAAITQRVTAADDVLGLFDAHAEELKLHGQTPKDAMARLLDLNQFAQAKPDEYLAWAAQQVGDATEVITKAAERLGLKLVKADANDDDPFEDEEIKQLREENRKLKGQAEPDFGPDAPQNKALRDLQGFVTAKDAKTGQLLRPDWPYVQGEVGREAKRILDETGKPVGIEKIAELYDAASARLRGIVAPKTATPAAQPPAPVADQKPNDAAAIQKSERAGKSIDGTGQGAGRRPALSDDADLTETIRHFATRG